MEVVFKVLPWSVAISLSIWIATLSSTTRRTAISKKNSDIKQNDDDTEENSNIKQNDDNTKEQDIKNDDAAEDHKNYTDTKDSKGEETVYSECDNYLKKREYPIGASKLEKAVLRNFEIVDGILHYRGKDALRQVVTDARTKEKLLEACHDDRIIQDADTWVSIMIDQHTMMTLSEQHFYYR